MAVFFLLLSLLHFLHFGIGVELTLTPSPVTEGGSLTLTCAVTENSSTYASFNYGNGTVIGTVQLSGGQCIDGTGQTCNQQCSCTTDGKSFSLTISSVTRSWDKVPVRCEVNNPAATVSDNTVVSVIYPPIGTLLMTPSGTQSILTGTPVTLRCGVGGGNPLATLTWQCKGSPVTGQNLTNTTTAVSSLTFTVDRTYHQQQCVCTAGHQASPGGQFGTVSVGFNVIYPPDGALTVTPSGTQSILTGTPVTLRCEVKGGNPLATLTWQCKGSSVTGQDLTNTTTAVSSLTFTVYRTYHQQQCVCTAGHQASPGGLFGTVSVGFNVTYPPTGILTIAPSGTQSVTVGTNITLRCEVGGGNPLATLAWQCKGSPMPGQNLTNTTTAVSSLTFTVDRTYHQQECVCTAGHQASTDGRFGTASIGFNVTYPPDGALTVTPSGTLSILTGTSVTLQCEVGGGNPLAILTWMCKGSSVTGQDLTNTTTAVSRLTFIVDRTYHQQQCVCTAGHQASPGGQFGTASVGFNVEYPPTVDTFAIHYSSPFYKGDNVYLDCIIDGGNPLATLSWTCVDQSRESSINMSTTTRAISRLYISSITEVYNNRTCTCTATHVGLSPSLTKSAGITVYYPPSTPVVAVDTTHGGRLPWLDRPTFTGILTCTSTAGNPPTTRISWYNNDVIEPGQSATTRRFEPPAKEYNGHTFTCRAANNYTDTKETDTESNRLMLNVEYDPIITLDESTAYINESLRFSRTCSAEGNPSPTVSWYRDSTLVRSNGTLQFSVTDRQDAGTYRCTATARSTNDNLLLQSSKLLSLVVQYGPDVDLAFTNTTENTTNFRLSCTANGVPDKYTFKWTHMFGSTLISDTFDQVTSSGSVSTLTIPRVTYQDMGTYVCDVDNGYRGRDGEIVQTRHGVLSIQGSPRAIRAQDRYVTEKGTSLDINITFISFPEPVNTTIIRTDSTVLPQSELSIIVSSVPVTVPFYNKEVYVDGYMVYLNFSDFRTRHQGHYQLYVRNVFDYFYNFEIIISDKPDPPSDLLIDQITQSSAVISWNPGDDNGNPQTFIVTYQNNKGGPPINTTLSYSTTSYIAGNLDVSTKYDVTVYASNAKGTSDTITTSFMTKRVEISGGNSALIGGAAGSAAAVILIIVCVVVVVVVIRRRRSHPSEQKLTEDESDDGGDGLKANILYESAGPYYPQQPGPSHENQSRDVYAVVDKSKPKVAETNLYAEVNKPKKGAPESSLYAEVQKKKKGKTKKVKKQTEELPESSLYADVKKKKKGKMATKEATIDGNIGDVPGAAAHGQGIEENIYENGISSQDTGSSRYRNAEGLIYLEVEFKEDVNKDRKFVIHGIENKTDYADVDFSKHADPLPEEEENKAETP